MSEKGLPKIVSAIAPVAAGAAPKEAGEGVPAATADNTGPVTPEDEESEELAAKRELWLNQATAEAVDAWLELARKKCWTEVKCDLEVYRHSGEDVKEDPRRKAEYAARVLAGLGFGPEVSAKDKPWLSEADLAAVREVLTRKAGAFWLEGAPRTTVRFVKHDTVPTGPPVKTPPHNLKGEAAEWIDEQLEKEVARGQLERGNSPWGSPPFPTKDFAEHKKQRKRRMVVDYRRVNARTLRSIYYLRRAGDVLAQVAGSLFISFVDVVTGFNLIINTNRARRMLAIVARSGQFLPRCLTFGPHNGPEDFAYVVDRCFAPGRHSAARRYCREWWAYVDDITIRTGRLVDGEALTDAEYSLRIRDSVTRANQGTGVGDGGIQSTSQALEALGFPGGAAAVGRWS